MEQKYERTPLIVDAKQYEIGKGMEDGFELYTRIITNGWICHDNLIQHIRGRYCGLPIHPEQARYYFHPPR